MTHSEIIVQNTITLKQLSNQYKPKQYTNLEDIKNHLKEVKELFIGTFNNIVIYSYIFSMISNKSIEDKKEILLFAKENGYPISDDNKYLKPNKIELSTEIKSEQKNVVYENNNLTIKQRIELVNNLQSILWFDYSQYADRKSYSKEREEFNKYASNRDKFYNILYNLSIEELREIYKLSNVTVREVIANVGKRKVELNNKD